MFNIARTYEALARFDEAYRYYAEYRDKETDATERAAIEKRLLGLAPRVALLHVDSEPPGATVFVDREDLGSRGDTPVTIALAPGPHTVVLRLPGHERAEKTVELARGRAVTASVALEAIVGRVRVTVTPPAEIRVDRSDGDAGSPDAESPAELRLAPGRRSLELRAPGFRSERREVVVEPRAEVTVDVALEPQAGTVAVGGAARGASVAVDGKVVGFVPVVVSVPEGDHTLTVSLEGYEPWQERLAVKADEQRFLEPELRIADPEIVAVTRQALKVGDAPASVSLLNQGEIQAFGYETVADALRSVRGFYDSDDRNYRAVGIRGFSRPGDYTNRVLVLRDNHVWNDDIVGSGFVGRDFAPDLEEVERIEVARGPGSTFYGQGAFFGVVNVVTPRAGEGPRVRAGTALLSDGGGRAFVRGAMKGSDAGVTLGASLYHSPGQTLHFDEFSDEPSGGTVRDADAEDVGGASLRARAGDFSLDAVWNRRRKEVPTASFDTVFDPAHAGTKVVEETLDRRAHVEGRFERDLGGTGLLLRVAFDHADYRGRYPYQDTARGSFLLTDEGAGNWLGGEARVDVPLPLGQRLTLGAEGAFHRVHLGYDDGERSVVDERDLHAASIYATDEIVLSSAARVTAGARLDRVPVGGDLVVSPRLAGVFRIYRDGRTKLVLGRAYRAPSFYEQYYSDGGVTQNPAPPLSPETIDTVDIEHTHELGPRAFVTASVFGSRIQRLIGLVEDPTSELLVYRNDEDTVLAGGVELEGRVAWPSGAWVSAAASVVGLSGGGDEVRRNSVPVAAVAKALVPVGPSATLAVEIVYNAPRKDRSGGLTDHAVLASIVGTGRLPIDGLRWKVGVQNLLDWRYSVPVGDEFRQLSILQDGRRFVASLVYEH